MPIYHYEKHKYIVNNLGRKLKNILGRQNPSREKISTLNLKCFPMFDIIGMESILGATRTKDAKELIHARQSVVVHAKAFGLQAIDMVYINFKGKKHVVVGERCSFFLS